MKRIPFWEFVRMCVADGRHFLSLMKDTVEQGALVMRDPDRIDPEELASVHHHIGLICDLLEEDEVIRFTAGYTRAERNELIALLTALAELIAIVPPLPKHAS